MQVSNLASYYALPLAYVISVPCWAIMYIFMHMLISPKKYHFSSTLKFIFWVLYTKCQKGIQVHLETVTVPWWLHYIPEQLLTGHVSTLIPMRMLLFWVALLDCAASQLKSRTGSLTLSLFIYFFFFLLLQVINLNVWLACCKHITQRECSNWLWLRLPKYHFKQNPEKLKSHQAPNSVVSCV